MSAELLAEIARLRAEKDVLEARLTHILENRWVNACLLADFFHITGKQAAILDCLSDGRLHHREHIAQFIGSGETGVNNISVQVHKMRRRGIHVTAHWGYGFKLEGELLQRVRDVLQRGREVQGGP